MFSIRIPAIRARLDTLSRMVRFAAGRSVEDRIPQVAGSLTFTTVLALMPLATVAFALFTAFPIFASFQSALQGFLAEHLMPSQINNEIFRYLNLFAAQARGLTAMGMAALVVTAALTMMTVESAFNVIWRVREARPLAQRMLVYWAILTLGPLLIGVSLSISSYLLGQSLTLSGAESVPLLRRWALYGAALPLSILAFTLLYVYLPNAPVAWRDAFAGGVFAAVSFELAKRGFGMYIRQFPTYTAVYGAFAAIPIFLLWVYLSWFVTLFGAMLTATLPMLRSGRYRRQRFAGDALFDALQILASLAAAREAGAPGRTVRRLEDVQRCDGDTGARVRARLEAMGWIGRLHPARGPQRYVLLANPSELTLAQLFDVFVMDRAELSRQLDLYASRIDGGTLLAALPDEKLQVSLEALMRPENPARPRPRSLGTSAPALAGTLLDDFTPHNF